LGRFLTDQLQHVQPWWYFIPVLFGLLFPWSPAIALLFRREDYRDKRKLLIAAVAAFAFIFFSASTNKLAGYVLPIVPLVAALIGIRLSEVPKVPVVFALCGLLLCAVPFVAEALPSAILLGTSRSSIEMTGGGLALLTLLLMAAAVAWRAETRAERWLSTGSIFAATLVCVVHLKIFTFPRMDTVASARPLWRSMQSKPDEACAPKVPRSIRYGLNYYAGYVLPACEAGKDRH
jgi:4-amino-4-deoxy-L-arabinose transferase-like glycosyltransferase